jgi:hypothetical protein
LAAKKLRRRKKEHGARTPGLIAIVANIPGEQCTERLAAKNAKITKKRF